jgi:hypothetical protein
MALTANVIKQKKDGFEFTISKENFESFCDSIGLYRQEFLHVLDVSEKDYRAGRVTRRTSFRELID